MNADKCGNHTFTQVRREKNVAAYRRNKVTNNHFEGFEVFLIKVVKAGAALPGGGKVAEDYEQYPGSSAFGKHAWSIGGAEKDAEKRAMKLFDSLLKTEIPVVVEAETEETETVPVARVVRGEVTLKLPDNPFTQRELAAANDLENYKAVYSDLQKMLKSGVLKVVGEKQAGRGKAAKLFQKV